MGAAILSTTLIGGSAFAQSTAMDWSGAYAGGFVGFGNYAGTAQDNGGDALDTDGQMVRLSDIAGEAGLVLGYNFQRSNLVYGAEIDYVATSFSTDEIYDEDYRQDAETKSLVSIRGRVGLAVENTLIYGTAGFGQASIFACASDDEESCTPDDDEIVTFDDTIDGLVFGAGIEHMLTDTLSFRAEYLQFEGDWSDDIGYDSDDPEQTARFSADSKAVRIGINYHF